MTEQKYINRLSEEKSPYLLQHAHNPVDWYPWGNEALEKAKKEDKPIFVSIGYSTCHWCHIMERESFEDEEVAALLNKHFIAIKVDREERPDIDTIYMSVCQALTGSGGWPLTILMTPDKKPFFAGTYFPKREKYGRMGIVELLNEAKKQWGEHKDEVINISEHIVKEVQQHYKADGKETLDSKTLKEAYRELVRSFDAVYGGFGNEPKFPTPHNFIFLLRYWKETGERKALEIVEKTLEGMYKGGIFDHIGYGFSRYSVDRKWLVPHFEKMLYDNALISMAYIEAYQATGKRFYRDVAEKIFTYILRDMASPEGGFYSAEDADSEGVEGKFYVWSKGEIEKVLGNEDAELFTRYYDITEEGNFEKKNIPNLINLNLKDIDNDPDLKNRLNTIRNKLFQVREVRVHPYKDDKVLTSWNGLMIAAIAVGGRVFGNKTYIDAARRAVSFILDNLVRTDERLLARYREGHSAYLAYQEDYAFLIWGLLELYEATYEEIYLSKALSLNDAMKEYFWDSEKGGYFQYGKDAEQLILRPKEIYDGAIPSGNSAAAMNLLRLSDITGSEAYEEMAQQIFKTFAQEVKCVPSAYSLLMTAFLYNQHPRRVIVIRGEKGDTAALAMIEEKNKRYLPNTTIFFNSGTKQLQDMIPFLKEQQMVDNKATAYICENFSCHEPVTSIEEYIKLLE